MLAVIAVLALLAGGLFVALSQTEGRARAMACASNQRQIMVATKQYMDENRGVIMPVWRQPNNPAFAKYLYDPATFMVRNANGLFWQDALRIFGHAKNPKIFDCPSMRFLSSTEVYGSAGNRHTLGIGMNRPEFGVAIWSTDLDANKLPKEQQVTTPSTAIVFADAGAATTLSLGLPPDDWAPDADFDAATMQYEGGGRSFFYSPSYAATSAYANGSARTLPRHNQRCNFSFFDGRVEGLKNSKAGYNYLRTSPNAWWARAHDSLDNNLVD